MIITAVKIFRFDLVNRINEDYGGDVLEKSSVSCLFLCRNSREGCSNLFIDRRARHNTFVSCFFMLVFLYFVHA